MSVTRFSEEAEQRMRDFHCSLNEKEKDSRRYAGLEAEKLGHGGISYISEIFGCDRKTVRKGIDELLDPPGLDPLHVRKKGGRKCCLDSISGLRDLAMREKRIPSLPVYPENRPCTAPTIFDIVRLFRHVERYEVTTGDKTIIFPADLTDTQKQVLALLEIPVAAYQ